MTGRKVEKDGPSTSSGRTGKGRVDPSTAPQGGAVPLPVPGRIEEGRIQANKHRKLQVTQSRRKLFGKEAKKDFLEWFAATANLGWSARMAGFNYKTVLRHR